MIFEKTVDLDIAAANDKAAITLMSTDIDGIGYGVMRMHEIWANLLELCLAIYLLELQVGLACFLVAVPAIGMLPFRNLY